MRKYGWPLAVLLVIFCLIASGVTISIVWPNVEAQDVEVVTIDAFDGYVTDYPTAAELTANGWEVADVVVRAHINGTDETAWLRMRAAMPTYVTNGQVTLVVHNDNWLAHVQSQAWEQSVVARPAWLPEAVSLEAEEGLFNTTAVTGAQATLAHTATNQSSVTDASVICWDWSSVVTGEWPATLNNAGLVGGEAEISIYIADSFIPAEPDWEAYPWLANSNVKVVVWFSLWRQTENPLESLRTRLSADEFSDESWIFEADEVGQTLAHIGAMPCPSGLVIAPNEPAVTSVVEVTATATLGATSTSAPTDTTVIPSSTPANTAIPSNTPTVTPTNTAIPTNTVEPTATLTLEPSETPTVEPSATTEPSETPECHGNSCNHPENDPCGQNKDEGGHDDAHQGADDCGVGNNAGGDPDNSHAGSDGNDVHGPWAPLTGTPEEQAANYCSANSPYAGNFFCQQYLNGTQPASWVLDNVSYCEADTVVGCQPTSNGNGNGNANGSGEQGGGSGEQGGGSGEQGGGSGEQGGGSGEQGGGSGEQGGGSGEQGGGSGNGGNGNGNANGNGGNGNGNANGNGGNGNGNANGNGN